MYIDIHTHKKETDENVYVLNNLDLNSLGEFIKMGKTVKNISIGIHPWWGDDLTHDEIESFFVKLKKCQNEITAIGECGLDRVCGKNFQKQIEVFKRHLDFPPHIPIILHNVRATSDFFHIIRNDGAAKTFILHDYSGNLHETKEWLKRGAYFSYGKKLMMGKHSKALDSLKIIPLSQLFLETDDMDVDIREVYESLAKIQNIDLSTIKKQLMENFNKVFGKID